MGNCGGRARVASEDEDNRNPTIRNVEVINNGGWAMPSHAAARILPVEIRRKSQKGIGEVSVQPKKPGF